MYPLTLSLANNPPGADPVVVLFAAIKAAYPSLPFTQANAKVAELKAWPAKYKPDRTYLRLEAKDDPKQYAEFYYNRSDVTLKVLNPLFTDTESKALANKTGVEVLTAIAAKVKLNLTKADFWVEDYTFTSTGGIATPNFRLEARYDSVFWYGRMNVWLHGDTRNVQPT